MLIFKREIILLFKTFCSTKPLTLTVLPSLLKNLWAFLCSLPDTTFLELSKIVSFFSSRAKDNLLLHIRITRNCHQIFYSSQKITRLNVTRNIIFCVCFFDTIGCAKINRSLSLLRISLSNYDVYT